MRSWRRPRSRRSPGETSEPVATPGGRAPPDHDDGRGLGSLVERSVTADTLIDELDNLALARGYPPVLRCDNGPELACGAMADWAGERVGLSFIPPGEPSRNGYVEAFNGRLACLWVSRA